MTSRLKPGCAAARVAGCALTLTLGIALAGPAFATPASAGYADPPAPPSSSDGSDQAPPNPDKPPAHPENNDKNYYCRSDPNWYMCQKPVPKH